jgi:hypothetical protein
VVIASSLAKNILGSLFWLAAFAERLNYTQSTPPPTFGYFWIRLLEQKSTHQ